MTTPHVVASSSSHPSQSSTSHGIVGNHYRVGKKIGEGSFGVVFEGLQSIFQLPCSPSPSSNHHLPSSVSLRFLDHRRSIHLRADTPPSPLLLLLVIFPDLTIVVSSSGSKISSGTPVAIKFVRLLTELRINSSNVLYRSLENQTHLNSETNLGPTGR